jgi:hypothetical protein
MVRRASARGNVAERFCAIPVSEIEGPPQIVAGCGPWYAGPPAGHKAMVGKI